MGSSVRFLGLMAVVLLLVFGIHLGILYWNQFPLFSDQIILSYSVNYAMAAILFLVIQRTLGTKASYAGFIFMLGSGIKFLLFSSFFIQNIKQMKSWQPANLLPSSCLIVAV